MADGTDDSLSVEVRLELERADREYEEKARKWAQPIRVPLEFVQQGGGAATPTGPQMTRSFGGMYAPMASAGAGPIGGSPVVGTVHQQVMSAAVQRGGGFGGAFVPGVGPVPTASTNTVYGQAGYASTFGPFGSVQALPGTARALPAPAVPMPGATPFDVGPGAAYQQTAATRALAVRQGYDPTGGYRPPLVTPVAGEPFMLPSPADRGMLAVRQAAAVSAPMLAGSGTPESPYQVTATRVGPAARAIPQLGIAPTSLGGAAGGEGRGFNVSNFASAVTALTYVASVADQQMSTIDRNRDRDRFDGSLAAAQGNFSDQRGTTGLGRRMGGLANRFFGSSVFVDNDSIADARDVALQAQAQQRDAELTREARGMRSRTGLIGAGAVESAIGLGRIATDEAIGANNREALANRFIGNVGDANAALGERQAASERLIRRTANDELLASSASRFYAGRAFDAEMGGDPFEARRQTLLEATQPAMDQARREFERSTGFDRSLAEERMAQIEQRQFAGQAVIARDERRFNIGLRGSRVAGNLDLGFDPLGAQLARIESRFDQETENGGLGVDENSPEYRRATLDRDLATRAARQASRIGEITLGNSLGAEGRSLDYSLERNEIGSRAASISGDAINRIQSIRRQGEEFADEAEDARRNSLKAFDVLKQDYAYSFRGQQVDLQNIFAANQRDAQDPAKAFAAIEDERKRVAGADAEAGIDKGENAASKPVVDAITNLPAAIATELGRIIAL